MKKQENKEPKQLKLIDYDYSFNHLTINLEHFVNSEIDRIKKKDEELAQLLLNKSEVERWEKTNFQLDL